jgi:hypothetical protein
MVRMGSPVRFRRGSTTNQQFRPGLVAGHLHGRRPTNHHLPETPFVVRRTPNVGMVGRAAELTLIRQIQPLEVASAAGDLARLSLRFEPMRHGR